MRLNFALLVTVVAAVVNLSIGNVSDLEPETVARINNNGGGLVRSLNDEVGGNTDANEEERVGSFKNLFRTKKVNANLPNDFAIDDLKKMMENPSFQLEMFKKWDRKYTVGDIRTALNLERSPGYSTLLLAYLNNFKRSAGLRS